MAFMRGTGVNDELDGTESKSAVRFVVPNRNIPRGIKVDKSILKTKCPYEMDCEVVQSLAKWKVRLGFLPCSRLELIVYLLGRRTLTHILLFLCLATRSASHAFSSRMRNW